MQHEQRKDMHYIQHNIILGQHEHMAKNHDKHRRDRRRIQHVFVLKQVTTQTHKNNATQIEGRASRWTHLHS
jgi:hypothetical protein